ncbi:peptidase M76 [Polychytrium aggregatum]|uniref:peptidase M76 n=1 Tax=Polychytrium aggregatum TaxID=110093 RepID=UPI0022FE2349|nr:peptidase M76 [Polychytrium aggregatum]KAI9208780.1 peptidase M76 [Polychytrium aggregatum]
MPTGPVVRFMMDELQKSKCPFRDDLFTCMPCDATRAGGFSPEIGVVLCQNQMQSKQHMEDTMTHELMHAYDHCTVKVNWSNPEQYACAEIRAITLSGECKFTRELRRGNFGFGKHLQTCVRRRAIYAMKQVPEFQEGTVAEDAVRYVWSSCFSDTAPFDEIY